MQELDFVKAHGIGNDFVIVDCLRDQLGDTEPAALAVQMCDRNFGIGGDGLILVLPSDIADYRMRAINSDGSEAEMCGNGIRCFAKYVFDRGMAGESISVETLAGVKAIDVFSGDGRGIAFEVNMGTPALEADDIPVSGYEGRVISRPLAVDDTTFDITCVSMGNPHCVIFVDSVEDVPLERLGPTIETHSAFPKKTNVEFAQAVRRDEVSVRAWERGAGVTLACGTGACATIVAGVLNDVMDRKATVHLPGGDLLIEWREDGEVYMTGPAQEVFTGKFCF